MIEDRYAHHNKNTLKYTNDKFICSDSETMDKITNLYNKFEKFLKITNVDVRHIFTYGMGGAVFIISDIKN